MNNKVIPFTDYKTIAPADMDSFSSGTIRKTNEISSNHGNGGGSDMDKYATKEELKTLETKIDGQFNALNAKLDGNFGLMNEKFSSINDKIIDNRKFQDEKFTSLPEQIKNIVHDSEDKQRKEINDNRKFIWGTIVIGGLATIASIVSVILTIVFH